MTTADTDEILRSWEQGCAAIVAPDREVGPVLQTRMEAVVASLLDWLDSGEDEPDGRVRRAFRGLAQAFRTEGIATLHALESMSLLEDLVLQDGRAEGSQTPLRSDRLTLCLRGLILDAVRMNMELDARVFRERADALSFFSEVLGHEIGNRLGAAQSAAELLRSPDIQVGAERREALLDLLIEGVESALTSVDDVTALMSSHAGNGNEAVPFGEVARGVLRTVGPMARKQGVGLEVEGELPDVPVNSARMRLLLTNLALNGVRYADPGKDRRWLRLQARLIGDELEVRVSDNGIGIEPDEQEEIFQYRERGTSGVIHSTDGSGLGLAVVAEAVAQMGGELGVDSTPGKGSTFWFRVPASGAETGRPTPPQDGPVPETRQS